MSHREQLLMRTVAQLGMALQRIRDDFPNTHAGNIAAKAIRDTIENVKRREDAAALQDLA